MRIVERAAHVHVNAEDVARGERFELRVEALAPVRGQPPRGLGRQRAHVRLDVVHAERQVAPQRFAAHLAVLDEPFALDGHAAVGLRDVGDVAAFGIGAQHLEDVLLVVPDLDLAVDLGYEVGQGAVGNGIVERHQQPPGVGNALEGELALHLQVGPPLGVPALVAERGAQGGKHGRVACEQVVEVLKGQGRIGHRLVAVAHEQAAEFALLHEVMEGERVAFAGGDDGRRNARGKTGAGAERGAQRRMPRAEPRAEAAAGRALLYAEAAVLKVRRVRGIRRVRRVRRQGIAASIGQPDGLQPEIAAAHVETVRAFAQAGTAARENGHERPWRGIRVHEKVDGLAHAVSWLALRAARASIVRLSPSRPRA
jgi:hypothetical protein